jgi:hypothetical protein
MTPIRKALFGAHVVATERAAVIWPNFCYEYSIRAYDPTSESSLRRARHGHPTTLGAPHFEPKIRCFPFQNPNFRYFLPFMVIFRLLFRR